MFPTRHALHVGPPGTFLAEAATKVLREADVILSLDWIDLAGTLKQAFGDLYFIWTGLRLFFLRGYDRRVPHLQLAWAREEADPAPWDFGAEEAPADGRAGTVLCSGGPK